MKIFNLKKNTIILTQKQKMYNAAFRGEAENLLYKQRDFLRKLSLPGIGEASILKLLEIKTEVPDVDYPEYCWMWIEAKGKLADAIQKHKSKNPEIWAN